MNSALVLALIAVAGTLVGAVLNGALATRAKVSEEMRQYRRDRLGGLIHKSY